MVTTSHSPATTTKRRDLSRYAGIAFAFFFITGLVLWTMPPWTFDAEPEAWAEEFTSDARRTQISLLAHVFWPAAGALLLVTAARIRSALDAGRVTPSLGGQVAGWSAVVMAVGIATMAGALSTSSRITTGGFGDSGFPPDIAGGYALTLLAATLGNSILWGGAVLMVAVGVASGRRGPLPGWLVWSGYVAAPLIIAAWYYVIPMVLFALWVAIAGWRVQTEPVPE